MSRSGATASITSDSSGERMSIAPNDTMNSRMLATPIGRNCRKPCSNATSDEARLTSWPVWSSSWLAKSRRWSWRNTAVRRSCCTSSAMRPPRNRRKYANTNVIAPIAIINASHGASGLPGFVLRSGRDHVVDDDLLHDREQRLDQLATRGDAERNVRVLLVRLHVADEPADPALFLATRPAALDLRRLLTLSGPPASRRAFGFLRGRVAHGVTDCDAAPCGDRVVEIAQRGEQRVGVARVLDDLREPFAHGLLGCVQRGFARARHGQPERTTVTLDRLAREQLAFDEGVDGRGHRRLREGEAPGDERRPLRAGGDVREHPVLGEGEVARRVLERPGGQREPAHRPGPGGFGRGGASGARHAGKDIEWLVSRTIPFPRAGPVRAGPVRTAGSGRVGPGRPTARPG